MPPGAAEHCSCGSQSALSNAEKLFSVKEHFLAGSQGALERLRRWREEGGAGEKDEEEEEQEEEEEEEEEETAK